VRVTPTHSARLSLAAAGAGPPRRPRGLRQVLCLAAVAGLIAACGSASPTATPGAVFRAGHAVSLGQLNQAIGALYRDHPGLASYSVQDVQYTAQSRATVLRECTSGSPGTQSQAAQSQAAQSQAAQSQAAESGQLIACAPLIFFLYRYGQDASVAAATTTAGELYGYAVTHISGPVDAKSSLDELLRSWGMPVPALTPAQAREALKASVIAAADDSILGQKSVHIAITGRKPGTIASAETIAADIGTADGTETIASGAASAEIRVTRRDAYFSGNATGLTRLLGLSSAAAAKVGSRWVRIAAGTAEYQDLAAEDTISSLPASIMPSSEETAQLRTTTVDGTRVYVLSWTTPASATSARSVSDWSSARRRRRCPSARRRRQAATARLSRSASGARRSPCPRRPRPCLTPGWPAETRPYASVRRSRTAASATASAAYRQSTAKPAHGASGK
jgi:hypothetical protein